MPIAPTVGPDLDELARTFARFETWRVEWGERLHAPVAQVSGWSAAQHLFHIALATDLALRNVRALVKDEGSRLVDAGEPSDLARRVLEGGGPGRGETEAPRMVRPGDTVEPEFLANEIAGCRRAVEELRGAVAEIEGARRRVPHQELGPLSAGEWVRFARLHGEHHAGIVEDVLSALG